MRYVLITYLPYSLTEKGQFKVDIDGWYWDLKAHMDYFDDLHVFAPMNEEIIPDTEDLTNVFSSDEIQFHPLPYFENQANFKDQAKFLLTLPKVVSIINREIKKDDIIHCTGNAIPPLGLIINFMCFLKGYKNRLLVMDADFISDMDLYSRTSENIFSRGFYTLLKAIYYPIYKYAINKTPLILVGGDNLLQRYGDDGNVVKYKNSWIKRKDIISDSMLNEKIHNRSGDHINLCFSATLIPKKNPSCAVKTVKILKERGIPCKLDILPIPFNGDTLEEEIKELIEKYELSDMVKIWGIVPYGEPFYKAIREHDIILVPNLSDEQPRIIFDAMANGTVVIGPTSKGFAIISNYENGILCNPQDPECFANAVEKLYHDRKILNKIALKGLETIKNNTIEKMHHSRKTYILETFELPSK